MIFHNVIIFSISCASLVVQTRTIPLSFALNHLQKATEKKIHRKELFSRINHSLTNKNISKSHKVQNTTKDLLYQITCSTKKSTSTSTAQNKNQVTSSLFL